MESVVPIDIISTAVGLDSDVYHKYVEAVKVMKPTRAKSPWENTDYHWMRVEVGSDEYMQAVVDHFEVVDTDDKMRILRKPQLLSSPAIDATTNFKGGVVA